MELRAESGPCSPGPGCPELGALTRRVWVRQAVGWSPLHLLSLERNSVRDGPESYLEIKSFFR